MMAQIRTERHGFNCTVLFSINKETGVIDTNQKDKIPAKADVTSVDEVNPFKRGVKPSEVQP